MQVSSSLDSPSPQERRGVALGPSAAQQGGDDERRRQALRAAAGRGVRGLLLSTEGKGGERGKGSSHHGPQPRPVPLRSGRSEVIRPDWHCLKEVNWRLLQVGAKHCL